MVKAQVVGSRALVVLLVEKRVNYRRILQVVVLALINNLPPLRDK